MSHKSRKALNIWKEDTESKQYTYLLVYLLASWKQNEFICIIITSGYMRSWRRWEMEINRLLSIASNVKCAVSHQHPLYLWCVYLLYRACRCLSHKLTPVYQAVSSLWFCHGSFGNKPCLQVEIALWYLSPSKDIMINGLLCVCVCVTHSRYLNLWIS